MYNKNVQYRADSWKYMKQNTYLSQKTMHHIIKTAYHPQSKKDVLEQISLSRAPDASMIHVVSLNPELIMCASRDEKFNSILSQGDIQIVDGVGVALAARFLGLPAVSRVPGVDLFQNLLHVVGTRGSRALLLGGKGKIADEIAKCYEKKYPNAKFFGLAGFSDITNPKPEELLAINRIVTDLKPRFVFVAFGSPHQELFIARHAGLFRGAVVMGVGGGFDFVGGAVPRAPRVLRLIGLEWLFRLSLQPWRARRQTAILSFVFAVLLQKFGRYPSRS